jgi:hypothetical protein
MTLDDFLMKADPMATLMLAVKGRNREVVCRGSLAIGTGCGDCQSCAIQAVKLCPDFFRPRGTLPTYSVVVKDDLGREVKTFSVYVPCGEAEAEAWKNRGVAVLDDAARKNLIELDIETGAVLWTTVLRDRLQQLKGSSS